LPSHAGPRRVYRAVARRAQAERHAVRTISAEDRLTFTDTTRQLVAHTVALVVALAMSAGLALAQARRGGAASPPATVVEPAPDPFGRDTPRGTVVGFLTAARRGDTARARQYLETQVSDAQAEQLAHQLFVVLDARLPARLGEISDDPAGTRADPLAPDREVIGTIASAAGDVPVVVERRERRGVGPIWLFSRVTLDEVPRLHGEVASEAARSVMPRFLVARRIGGVRLLDWLAVLLGLPLVYAATGLLNRLLTPIAGAIWRRASGGSTIPGRDVLPAPARVLVVAIASRWLLHELPLSLLVRQGLTILATLVSIAAAVWLLFVLNGVAERHLSLRVTRAPTAAAVSLLRVGRRVVDLLVLLAGLLATLRVFGVDPTPVLAGLGVGGLAVALAAQKTLENVIAGASLIFDEAVRVGDFLRVGEIQGTVDYIGLRSIRIRTLDRTVVTVPNSQIANMTLETLSTRDKFWFHPLVGLRYETTAPQLRAVLDGIRDLLATHPAVEPDSVRVRLLRLGAFSLDVDVFAYVRARDWSDFLAIQEDLLVAITAIVSGAGTEIAFPSQRMYVSGSSLPISGSTP
jgi:MscS family membrane protein